MVSPERLAVAMMERLRPPDNKASIIASERMPSSGIWKAIDCSVLTEKNRSPMVMANTNQSATNNSIRVAIVPLPAKRIRRPRRARVDSFLMAARSGSAVLAATRLLPRPRSE
ncbi:hypothetical protein ACVWZ3_006812 [Bradyrhizobium sp. i1.3.6]